MQECLISELVACETYYTFMGAIQGRRLAVQDPYMGAPIETKRGYLSFQASLTVPNETFADIFGCEALRDPKFTVNKQRSQHVEEARAVIAEAVKDREAKDLFVKGSQLRALMGVVQTAPDLLACEQLAARDCFVEGGASRRPQLSPPRRAGAHDGHAHARALPRADAGRTHARGAGRPRGRGPATGGGAGERGAPACRWKACACWTSPP